MTSRTAHATETKVVDPDRGLHRHHLLPLADADSVSLLDKLAADDANPLPGSVREWSVAAAEGNPFYLRELVRHWVETRQVFGVPRSLAELIEARLNRLSSLALRVLQLCAAFGKHSTFERLEKATGYQNHVLLDAIEELSGSAMLAPNDPVVSVKHDLLAAAALDRLGGAALKLIHRQVAITLEAEITENHAAALVWDCAQHWQIAGDTAHALATVRLCASHLYSVGQIRECIELYEKALQLCGTTRDRGETLLGLAAALKAAGRWNRLEELITHEELRPADQHHPISVDNSLQLLRIETEWRLRTGSDANIAKLLVFANDQSKTPAERLQAAHLGIILCSEKGRKDDASSFLRIAHQLEAMASQRAVVAHIRMIFHADFGDLDNAVAYGQTLLALEETRDDPAAFCRARTDVSICYRIAGRIEDARMLLKDNLAFAVDHGLAGQAARVAVTLAMAGLQEENFTDAAYWHACATEHARAVDERTLLDAIAYVKARLSLHEGDLEPAQDFLARISTAAPREEMSIRIRQTEAAIRWRVCLATGRDIDRADIERIEREFNAHCSYGLYDFFALCLHDAIMAVGEVNRAATMLLDYVQRTRRDRSPLPPSLADAVRSATRFQLERQ